MRFKNEIKDIRLNFKGVSLKQVKPTFLGVENPTSRPPAHVNNYRQ